MGDYTPYAGYLHNVSIKCSVGNAEASVTIDGNEVLHPSYTVSIGLPALEASTTVSGNYNANTTFGISINPILINGPLWQCNCDITVSP